MKFWRAVGAGALGGVGLAAAFAVAQWLLGRGSGLWSWAVPALDLGARVAAWGATVMVAAAFGAASAVVYAMLFEYVTRRAGWRVGAAIGALHGGTLAAVAAFLPRLVERAAHALNAAPLGLRHVALALAVLVAAGIAFGALVGAWYGAPRHVPDVRTRVWWRELSPTARRFR